MKRLCTGIVKLTPGWKIILDQAGIWYEEVAHSSDLNKRYSSIIVNQLPDSELTSGLNTFLKNGGSILETCKEDHFFTHKSIKKSAFLFNKSSHPAFRSLSFLDLYDEAAFSDSEILEGLVCFRETDEGALAFCGLDPDRLLEQPHYKRRRFYFSEGIYPDEIVSRSDLGKVTEVITQSLKELHFRAGLPFINKWISPAEDPYFAFRIDSDYGHKESIQSLYALSRSSDIPFTWFLHVEAHEDWLGLFNDFEGQEIALHGYEHATSDSYEHIFNNIERGDQLLKDAGMEARGFCAPYGIWNESLAEVLTEFSFSYSSEFTCGYDALPFHPLFEGKEHPVLQIPIHPICTGSLNRRAASSEMMKRYFEEILRIRAGEKKPLIFYHHPLQPGSEIWKPIFEQVHELGFEPLTFGQIASFRKDRDDFTFIASSDTVNRILLEDSTSNVFLQVCNDHDGYDLIKGDGIHEISKVHRYKYDSRSGPSEEEVRNMRAGRLKLLKTSILDWRNRRRI